MEYFNNGNFLIRDWAQEDVEIFKIYMNGEKVWMSTESPWISSKNNFDHEVDIARKELESFQSGNTRMSLPICDAVSNKMTGFVNSYWRGFETNWMRIGIRIFDSSCWGKGIAYTSLKFWINYNFNNRPELVRLEMTTWSGNQAITHLALKLGFRLEACHRQARNHNGNKYDAISYGILREEWKS